MVCFVCVWWWSERGRCPVNASEGDVPCVRTSHRKAAWSTAAVVTAHRERALRTSSRNASSSAGRARGAFPASALAHNTLKRCTNFKTHRRAAPMKRVPSKRTTTTTTLSMERRASGSSANAALRRRVLACSNARGATIAGNPLTLSRRSFARAASAVSTSRSHAACG